MRKAKIWVSAIGLSCLTSICSAKSVDPASIIFAANNIERHSENYKKEIAASEKFGRLLFEHDRAAALATDFFAGVDSFNFASLRGWIEEPIGDDAFRILFYGKGDSGYFPSASVDVANGVVVQNSYTVYGDEAVFSPVQGELIAARELALSQPFDACSDRYNTVTIPLENGDIYVYLLAATLDPDVAPFGGHYRFRITPGDQSVSGFARFTRGCINLPRSSKGPNPDTEVVGRLISHLVTPFPSEIHVWWSFQLPVPLFVFTTENNLIWAVENGEIRLDQELRRTTDFQQKLILESGEFSKILEGDY